MRACHAIGQLPSRSIGRATWHVSLVSWADFDEVEGTWAMLMEYVKGHDMPLYESLLEAVGQLLEL